MSFFGDLLGGEDVPSPVSQAKKYYNNLLKPFFEQYKAESDAFTSSAMGTQRDIFNLLGEGFGNARANVAQQGRVGTQGILDAQAGALGASQQAAIGAGFSGGSPHMAANRGIASDTARNIAGLQAALGGIYAGLDTGQAQAQGSALNNLSQLQAGQANNAQNFLGMLLGGLNQTPLQAPQEGGLGPLLGGVLGAAGAAGGFGNLFAGL